MVKDLVVNLTGASPQDFAADYAISVAAAFSAHAAGMAFVYEPVIPDSVLGGVPTDLIETQRADNAQAARAAVERFEAGCRAAGVSFETRIIDASIAGAADLFGRAARRFDLSIVGQARREEGASGELMIEGALFESGRPVILVPFNHKQPFAIARVLVCWDGSLPATRAIAAAIPFLQRAQTVQVLVVSGERGKGGELAGTRMAAHLNRHGIALDLIRLNAGKVDVQSAIRAYAGELGAEFLVMGGYGHSRLREFLLGGVTRAILNSMPVPVLMSH